MPSAVRILAGSPFPFNYRLQGNYDHVDKLVNIGQMVREVSIGRNACGIQRPMKCYSPQADERVSGVHYVYLPGTRPGIRER